MNRTSYNFEFANSGEARTLVIVRVMTCIDTAVAGFVAGTLAPLIGSLLVSAGTTGVWFRFGF